MATRPMNRKEIDNALLILLFSFLAASKSFGTQNLPEYDCLIEPWQRIDISFAEKGLVSQVLTQQSGSVQPGQVLATLDSALEQANVDLAQAKAAVDDEIKALEATVAFNERNAKRLRDLYNQKAIQASKLDEAETEAVIAKQKLLSARTNRQLAMLELKLAQVLLNRRQLVSPIAGSVVKIHKHAGEYVEYEPVMTLEQPSPLRIQVLLPVMLVGKVKAGMQAKVTPERPMDYKERYAKVVVVDSNIDVASGTFGVQLELENSDLGIPSGLKCSIQFVDPIEIDASSAPATP